MEDTVFKSFGRAVISVSFVPWPSVLVLCHSRLRENARGNNQALGFRGALINLGRPHVPE